MVWRYIYFFSISLYLSSAAAKGLDELGAENPERRQDTEDQKQGTPPQGDPQTQPKHVSPEPNRLAASLLNQRLRLSTSFGRIIAKKGDQHWKANGASDITAAFLTFAPEKFKLYATFRYTPIAVTSRKNQRFQRGMWQVFDLGTQLQYPYSEQFSFLGMLELGFIKVDSVTVDKIEPAQSSIHQAANFGLGTGFDMNFRILEKCSIGPRLYLSFGEYQFIQTSAAFSFYF